MEPRPPPRHLQWSPTLSTMPLPAALDDTPMEPYTVLCTYLVRTEKIEPFHDLLRRHWPALRQHGLVTEDPPIIYFGIDASGPFFVEILTWTDPTAPGKAYWTADINDIWTDFYAFTEMRDGRPAIEYPKVELQRYFQQDEALHGTGCRLG